MHALTAQQQDFVDKLVATGCTPTEAARAAGYSVPHVEASRLIRKEHVQAAIRQTRDRLISAHGANVALATLLEIMKDREAPASARVGAARTMLEVAGHFDKDARQTGSKSLQEMSADELQDTLSKLDDQISRMGGPVAVH